MKTIELTAEVGGPDFNCRKITDALDGAGAVHVVIDSGGGCSITSFAIYRQLIEHDGVVTTEIIRAGSAAVLPALAGQYRTIQGDGNFFLHRCWAATIGTAETMAEAAECMEAWDSAAADLYAERTGLPLEQIVKLTHEEITVGAAQALELGFVHEILGAPQPVPEAYSTFHQQRTELSCLDFAKTLISPAMRDETNRAEPVAQRQPGAAHAINTARKYQPKAPPGRSEETLERFVENRRREADIQRGLATKLRRVIGRGGRIDWPCRVSWNCACCSSENFGPPAKNKLSTPCRTCGAKYEETTP